VPSDDGPGMSTVVASAPTSDPEPTKAIPPPRVSAPRSSTGSQRAVQPRKTNTGIQPAARRESSAVGVKKKDEAADESPPWMHPYVLATGGLSLLAPGSLIGVLLR